MSKIKTKNETVKRISQLTVINPTAAGVDVSDTEMMVAYPINSVQLEVRVFGCYTIDLHSIAKTLKANGITTVAMESTGVYWIPLFLLLQEYGFEVCLVNAKHVKNVTGRKDDESDAEWIQKLHSCGLLRASFQPDSQTRTLRGIVRHRKSLESTCSVYINRIQKQLIEQIASKNGGVVAEIAEVKRKASKKHKLPFNATSYLKEIFGVDITEVFGISELSALAILSEVGTDMSKWKTEHHFTSWLGLAPNTKISGGKIISSRIMKKKHHAGQAFRMAANGLHNSKSPIGDYYRRLKAKAGAGKAVVATARKLAIIFYKMVACQQNFNPKMLIDFQEKYKQKKINQLKRKLQLLEAA